MRFARLDASRPAEGIDFNVLDEAKWEEGKRVVCVTRQRLFCEIFDGELFEDGENVVIVDQAQLGEYLSNKGGAALKDQGQPLLESEPSAVLARKNPQRRAQKVFVPTDRDLLLHSIYGGYAAPSYSGIHVSESTHTILPFPEQEIKILATGVTHHSGEATFGHTLFRLNPGARFQVASSSSSLDSASSRTIFRWNGSDYVATKYVNDRVYIRSSQDGPMALDPEDDEDVLGVRRQRITLVDRRTPPPRKKKRRAR